MSSFQGLLRYTNEVLWLTYWCEGSGRGTSGATPLTAVVLGMSCLESFATSSAIILREREGGREGGREGERVRECLCV